MGSDHQIVRPQARLIGAAALLVGALVAWPAPLSAQNPPTERELAVLRHLDPDRLYTA